MTNPRLITDEELAALREWWESDGSMPINIINAILARNPAPWEPSEEDITAYCEAWGWTQWHSDLNHQEARKRLIAARKRGIEITFRRIEGES